MKLTHPKRLALCGLLMTMMACQGCEAQRNDEPHNEDPRNDEPIPRIAMNDDMKSVADGDRQFALDMYSQLRTNKNGNFFFSPNSIRTALAMTYAGARGATEVEMAAVLQFALTQDRLHAALGAMAKDLNADPTNRGYQLDIANRLWPRLDVSLLDDFRQTLKDEYGADVVPVDFAGDTEGSRQLINRWVEEKTNERIKELIKRDVINSSTALILTNAIYFKGDWEHQFNPDRTHDAQFHVNDDTTVSVPMMYQKEKFRFMQTDDLKLIELPYQGGDVSMLILLPTQVEGLAALEDRMTVDQLAEWEAQMRSLKLDVWLPKFKMTSEFQLKDALSAMGMPTAFSDTADFSGINQSIPLRISAVVHKAFVEVNEEGTEAAAATAVIMAEASAALDPPEFKADRPFLFLIRDNHSGSVLFMGRMNDPSA